MAEELIAFASKGDMLAKSKEFWLSLICTKQNRLTVIGSFDTYLVEPNRAHGFRRHWR